MKTMRNLVIDKIIEIGYNNDNNVLATLHEIPDNELVELLDRVARIDEMREMRNQLKGQT